MKDNTKWKDLAINDKIKLSIAGSLVASSIILGFVSFIILLEVPTSIIGLDGLWLSTALAVLGITAHFNNEMTKFQANVRNRLDRLSNDDKYIMEESNDEILDNGND